MSYAAAIIDRIRDCLDADGLKYDFDAEKNAFIFSVGLDTKMRSADVIVDIREDLYIVNYVYPLKADTMMYPEVIQLINRVNFDLVLGCFDLDHRDGEIRCHYAVDCENRLPSQDVIRNSIYAIAATMERYGDAMLMTMLDFASPEEAYNRVED